MEWLMLFGGIGGAVIGFGLNQWVNSRNQKRLAFTTETQRFALPDAFGKSAGKDQLKVSWAGVQYKSLSRRTYRLENVGRATIQKMTLVVHLPRETQIVDVDKLSMPLPLKAESKEEALAKVTQLTFALPELEAGDKIAISILYNGEHPVYAAPRGGDGVKYAWTAETRASAITFCLIISSALVVGTAGAISIAFKDDPRINMISGISISVGFVLMLGACISLAKRMREMIVMVSRGIKRH